MKNSLLNDCLKLLKNHTFNNPKLLYGDERQVKEVNKILANGLTTLCCILSVFAIISETLNIQFKIEIPFTLVEQILFIIGVVCYICTLKLLTIGIISGNTLIIFISGIIFPSFLMSNITDILLDKYKRLASTVEIILIPIIILILYFIANHVYNKNILKIENE